MLTCAISVTSCIVDGSDDSGSMPSLVDDYGDEDGEYGADLNGDDARAAPPYQDDDAESDDSDGSMPGLVTGDGDDGEGGGDGGGSGKPKSEKKGSKSSEKPPTSSSSAPAASMPFTDIGADGKVIIPATASIKQLKAALQSLNVRTSEMKKCFEKSDMVTLLRTYLDRKDAAAARAAGNGGYDDSGDSDGSMPGQ